MPDQAVSETVASQIDKACSLLASCSDSPRLDAEILMALAAGISRSTLFAWPGRRIEPARSARFMQLVRRRAGGEPLAYITGEKEFWSLPLRVTPDTLVPRPETELLVEEALQRCPPSAHILELGTGSGAIALALASERPGATITATEQSPGALDVARDNAVRLGFESRLDFRHAADGDNWFGCVPEALFDVIVSNPPYVADLDPALGNPPLCFEPRPALASGSAGMDALAQIIAGAPRRLRPGGWLVLEHGSTQAGAVADLLAAAGFTRRGAARDLAGHQRVSFGRAPQPGV